MPTDAAAAAATLVAIAFGLSTFERYLTTRARHHLAWSVALALFTAAAAAMWLGATAGWDTATFRVFYLFGGVANVPVLALGTVYLLGSQRLGDRVSAAAGALVAFAAGVLVAAPATPITDPGEIPQGSDVFGALPRALAALASSLGALVILGGCLYAIATARRRRAGSQRRVVTANGLLAAGTLVLSTGGVLNSVVDEMTAFSISLVAGATLLFAGFLVAPQR